MQRLIAKPVQWVTELPALRPSRAPSNLAQLAYTAHDPHPAKRPPARERFRRLLNEKRLRTPFHLLDRLVRRSRHVLRRSSPAYLARKSLQLAMGARAKRALTLIPKILGDDGPIVHVVDAGAAERYNPMWDHFGSKIRVHMFEPERLAYEQLLADYRDDPRLQIHNTLLSADGRPLTLNVFLWPRGSSIFNPNYAFLNQTYARRYYETVTQETFPSKRLDDVLGGVDVSFVKADVEGFELEILRGAGTLLDRCVGLELELWFNPNVHLGAPRCGDIIQFCYDRGFAVVSINTLRYWHYLLPHPGLESRGFLLNGDMLFLRLPHSVVELVKSKAWPQEKIAVAACLYLVHGHHELAFHLIERAVQAGVLAAGDPVARNTMECVRQYSGFDRLIPSKHLKAASWPIENLKPNCLNLSP